MFKFNTIEEALEDLRQGKIVLVTRRQKLGKTKGTLSAQRNFATTDNVNFMATHGKGLIYAHEH